MKKTHRFSKLGKLALLISVPFWSFSINVPPVNPVTEIEVLEEEGSITFINNTSYSDFFPDDYPRELYFFVVDVKEPKNIYKDDLVYDDMLLPGEKITYTASQGEKFIIYASFTTSANDSMYECGLYPGVKVVKKFD